MRIFEITSASDKINNADARKYDAQRKLTDRKDRNKNIDDPAKRREANMKANASYQKSLNTQNNIQKNARQKLTNGAPSLPPRKPRPVQKCNITVITAQVSRDVEMALRAWCVRNCIGKWHVKRVSTAYSEFTFYSRHDAKKFSKQTQPLRELFSMPSAPIAKPVGSMDHFAALMQRCAALANIVTRLPQEVLKKPL